MYIMNPINQKTNILKKILKIKTETEMNRKIVKNEEMDDKKPIYFHGSAYMSSPKASEVPLPPDEFFL